MKKLVKAGRWAFLLPYIIAPAVILITANVSLSDTLRATWLHPLIYLTLFDDKLLLCVYPLCYLITIICLCICSADKEGKKLNRIIACIFMLLVIIRFVQGWNVFIS